jgi:hypothetical protein
MTLTVKMVTIDCAAPKELVPFWSAAMGYEPVLEFDEFVILASPGSDGAGPAIGLQQVPEPASGKNRVHIDLHSPDRPTEVARLVGLGATVVGEHDAPGLVWTVLADPVGNQFCVAG